MGGTKKTISNSNDFSKLQIREDCQIVREALLRAHSMISENNSIAGTGR